MLRHRTLVVDLHRFDNVPLGKILKDLGDQFLENNDVQQISAFYGDHRLKVQEEELCFILQIIHKMAMTFCIENCKDCETMPDEEANSLLRIFNSSERISFPFELLKGELIDPTHRASVVKKAENAFQDIYELNCIQFRFEDASFLYGLRKDENGKKIKGDEISGARQRRNWMSVAVDFPRVYIEQMKELIYPESYVVCFSDKNNNSAMWGNYADDHQGVCLIYETGEKNNLTVRGEHTLSVEAKPVNYGGGVIERNFFESFGRLNRIQIKAWLTGKKGLSSAYEAMKDEEEWRRNYWNAHEAKLYRKLKAWEYESEYRLVITDVLYDFSVPEKRNLKYDPKCLKGVIFGINTTEYDKWRIMKALREHSNDYKDFIFYQAEYAEEGQSITIRKKLWSMD